MYNKCARLSKGKLVLVQYITQFGGNAAAHDIDSTQGLYHAILDISQGEHTSPLPSRLDQGSFFLLSKHYEYIYNKQESRLFGLFGISSVSSDTCPPSTENPSPKTCVNKFKPLLENYLKLSANYSANHRFNLFKSLYMVMLVLLATGS